MSNTVFNISKPLLKTEAKAVTKHAAKRMLINKVTSYFFDNARDFCPSLIFLYSLLARATTSLFGLVRTD